MSQGPTTDQIAEMLRDRMRDLPQVWGLQGHVRGNDFVCRSPFRDDRHEGSFRIAIRGKVQGLIKDFSEGRQWSALSFTADLWFGGDVRQAVAWAKAWLGLDGTDPDSFARTIAAKEQRAQQDQDWEAQVERARRQAQAMYLSALPGVIDTPVDAYLLGRGIDLARLPFAEKWFRGVRFHPALWNKEAGRKLPAMVAAITADDGTFLSVHRTWLAPDGKGGWGKAPLDEPKLSYGSFAGRNGLIRLWRGVRIDRETGQVNRLPAWRDMRHGEMVHITEGIEDALSVAVEIPEARCVAGVSIDNMVGQQWPDPITKVAVWAQNDPPGSPAAQRMAVLIDNYRRQGKTVLLPRPPAGQKDVNDVLRQAQGAALQPIRRGSHAA